MQDLYPAPPANPPADLTRPSRGYRQRAWLAMSGLMLFVLLYLSLSVWFVWTAYTTVNILATGGHIGGMEFFVAIFSAFLAVFMLKAVFFIKRGEKDTSSMEITAQNQPRLFAFLNRLADEAGAPRPHRVFLSPRVNACVFYDLSVFNLIWPSRKNLEIGMGLVNILSVAEFKAVCAHEFGHFAQRSMAVGRWVYMAQQIAGHIVARRDMLDTFLEKLSHIDIRIAWVGWLLRLIVWSLRSLVDTAFTLVVLAQRSLSREMELQADLVAVSLTGSDALINALHRLQAADDAWDRTLNFVGGELQNKRIPDDVFPLQTHILQRMGELLDNPEHGSTPKVPAENPQDFRVFKPELAQPPRMWATHPFSHERETNAKQVYLAAADDPTSAWALFDAPEEIRRTVTHNLYRQPEGEPCTAASCIEKVDLQFQREHLDRKYRGVYYGRSPMRAASSVADLYGAAEGAEGSLDKLYPDSIPADLEQCETLERELALLENLRNGRLDATGGIIRHRGVFLRKRELPQAIAQVRAELEEVRQRITAHDVLCRTTHRTIAVKLGNGWEDYLIGLAAALHYADHSTANLRDAQRALRNTIALATATGRVSKANHARVVSDASGVYKYLEGIFRQAVSVHLDERLLAKLEIADWPAALGKFELNPPTSENIGDWLKIIDGWIDHTTGALGSLQRHALDELLLSEGKVAEWYRSGSPAETAPAPTRIKTGYPVLLPGSERQLQTRLSWWERFLTADGLFAGILRLTVALLIVGTVLAFGNISGQSHVTIHNALGRTVRVDIGKTTTHVVAYGNAELTLSPGSNQKFATYTESGELIETFVADVKRGSDTQVYNIASAAPLTEWTATYGGVSAPSPQSLGPVRWHTTQAQYVFSEPPESVSSRSGNTRLVLSAPDSQSHPELILQALGDEAQQRTVVAAHVRWDAAGSHYLMNWMTMLPPDQLRPLINARLHSNPQEIVALRLEQDLTDNTAEHAGICRKDIELARNNPGNADLQYIAIRCLPDQAARDRAFLDGYAKYPGSGWLAFAAGYVNAEQQNWDKAQSALLAASHTAQELAGISAYDLIRVSRMGNLHNRRIEDLPLQDAPMAKLFLAIEADKLPEDADISLRAWAALAHGRIEEALRLARGTSSEETILRLAACSEGAPAALIQRALNLPGTGLNENSRPMMLALALREHGNATAYIDKSDSGKDSLGAREQRFLELAGEGRFSEAELALNGLIPQYRGRLLAMGVVFLGTKAPSAWREDAKRLLFATEHPWFN